MSPADKVALEVSKALGNGRVRDEVAASILHRQPSDLEPLDPEPRWVEWFFRAGFVLACIAAASIWACGGPKEPSPREPSGGATVAASGVSVPGVPIPPSPSGPGAALEQVSSDLDEIEARMHRVEQSIAFRRGLLYATDPARSMRGMP